jgi:hypothetical protein
LPREPGASTMVYETVRAHHSQLPIRPNRTRADSLAMLEPQEEPTNSLEPTKQPRDWGVERLHSWQNRPGHLLVHWEKLCPLYETCLHLTCPLTRFQQLIAFERPRFPNKP